MSIVALENSEVKTNFRSVTRKGNDSVLFSFSSLDEAYVVGIS